MRDTRAQFRIPSLTRLCWACLCAWGRAVRDYPTGRKEDLGYPYTAESRAYERGWRLGRKLEAMSDDDRW